MAGDMKKYYVKFCTRKLKPSEGVSRGRRKRNLVSILEKNWKNKKIKNEEN